ncbi:MAG TPA: FmdB family transcriptional regulator [Caldithrix abyssi]|uniref:FmdB family transcriptional regulator n=1 Tax=Caldithrix abyssi TaxID=187145 RepID=A0A7V5UEY3_CALAY|nr:FmdB family transcriptional regulator [Caldithrix abyssi]
MPTYTYKCRECEYKFDKRQSFSDDPLRVCPECGAENGLRKVVNSVGILFKGSGFYVTDNRNGSSAKNVVPGKADPKKKSSEGEKSAAPAESSANGSGKKAAKEKSTTVSS